MTTRLTVIETTKAMDWLEKNAPEFVEEYVKAVVESLKKQTIITDLQTSLTDEFGDLFENMNDVFPVDNADEKTKMLLTTRIIKISEINNNIQKAKI